MSAGQATCTRTVQMKEADFLFFYDAMENLLVVIGMEKIKYGEKKEDITSPKESSGGSLTRP